jgi:hypothetical protein
VGTLPTEPPAMPSNQAVTKPSPYRRQPWGTRRYGQSEYSEQVLPQTPPLQGAFTRKAYTAPKVAAVPHERNAMLAVAQFLALVQGVAALAIGIYVIWQLTIGRLGSTSGVASAVSGVFFNLVFPYALATLVVAVVMIVAGVRVGGRSRVARWLLAIWEVVAFVTILAFVTNSGVWLGSLSIVVIASSGVEYVSPYVVLAVEALVIYGLAIDPATHRTFAR